MYIQITVVFLYFGNFLAKNILSINLKVHFPRGRVGVLQNTARDESFHSDALSEIDFVYSTKESEKKTLNVFSGMENSPKMNEKKLRLSA